VTSATEALPPGKSNTMAVPIVILVTHSGLPVWEPERPCEVTIEALIRHWQRCWFGDDHRLLRKAFCIYSSPDTCTIL